MIFVQHEKYNVALSYWRTGHSPFRKSRKYVDWSKNATGKTLEREKNVVALKRTQFIYDGVECKCLRKRTVHPLSVPRITYCLAFKIARQLVAKMDLQINVSDIWAPAINSEDLPDAIVRGLQTIEAAKLKRAKAVSRHCHHFSFGLH